MDLQELQHSASICTQCDLHKGRIKPVFAKGNPKARIMICGMVPADEENNSGIPFVGRAGKLLDQILSDIGLTLDDVYITNLVKCYLAAGKPLEQDWIEACLPYLMIQIETIRPRVILTLGKDSSINLLGIAADTTMGSIRGSIFDYVAGIEIVPTYHPSYVLRNGGRSGKLYKVIVRDFQLAKQMTVDYGNIPF